ncbi:hypothetical protein B0H10DRAFT_2242456 [Mycena sp. CBHHK59/15]|nr:hypothetical protein B0H10DRAFT_2242456 [Mycena sp. CBHHK59/15]
MHSYYNPISLLFSSRSFAPQCPASPYCQAGPTPPGPSNRQNALRSSHSQAYVLFSVIFPLSSSTQTGHNHLGFYTYTPLVQPSPQYHVDWDTSNDGALGDGTGGWGTDDSAWASGSGGGWGSMDVNKPKLNDDSVARALATEPDIVSGVLGPEFYPPQRENPCALSSHRQASLTITIFLCIVGTLYSTTADDENLENMRALAEKYWDEHELWVWGHSDGMGVTRVWEQLNPGALTRAQWAEYCAPVLSRDSEHVRPWDTPCSYHELFEPPP